VHSPYRLPCHHSAVQATPSAADLPPMQAANARSSVNAPAYCSSQCNAPGQQTECADIKCTGLCCTLRPNRNGVLSAGAVFACAHAELLLLFNFAAAVRSVCRFFSDCGQSGMQVRAAVQAGAMNCKRFDDTPILPIPLGTARH